MEKRLVLASGSPRRKVLLEQVGLVIDVVPSGIEETAQEGEDPENRVVRLARQKAACVASRLRDRWVIGADTIVLIDSRILGKPRHPDEAKGMLSLLSGRDHWVLTGYAIARRDRAILVSRVQETRVRLKPLCSEEIEWYVQTGEPLGKAGGYAIQGVGCFMVEEVEGSYTNVVGLPVCQVLESLRTLGALRLEREGSKR
jgi:septum formation protein